MTTYVLYCGVLIILWRVNHFGRVQRDYFKQLNTNKGT